MTVRAAALITWLALSGAVAAAETITLAVWTSQPAEEAALDRTIAAFTRATGIVVKKESIGDKYMDVLRSRFAARNTPDVFYLDSAEAPLLIGSDVLEPFDSRIDDAQDFYPQFLDAFRGENRKIYGLPKDYSTLALYVNTRLLARAGFKPSDVPTDHAELMAFARRLQPRLPKGSAALIYEKDLARHMSALEAFGDPVITSDGWARLSGNAGALAYLDGFVRGRKEGYLFSPKDDLGADSPAAAFGSGRAAMMMEGNWVLSALHKDYP
ncbi:MAG TPA: extracellular solute-binding protein, partial [Albitalea sp.]|nr:extracellular solute-binding protein [Albitalea sp.]